MVTGLHRAELRDACTQACGQCVRGQLLCSGRIGHRREKESHIHVHSKLQPGTIWVSISYHLVLDRRWLPDRVDARMRRFAACASAPTTPAAINKKARL